MFWFIIQVAVKFELLLLHQPQVPLTSVWWVGPNLHSTTADELKCAVALATGGQFVTTISITEKPQLSARCLVTHTASSKKGPMSTLALEMEPFLWMIWIVLETKLAFLTVNIPAGAIATVNIMKMQESDVFHLTEVTARETNLNGPFFRGKGSKRSPILSNI